MRNTNLISILTFLLFIPTSTASIWTNIAVNIPDIDFISPYNSSSDGSQLPLSDHELRALELRKRNGELQERDGNCPTNYNSCSTLAAIDAGICCTKNAICSLDFANQVACCPTGAVCTGTISLATTVSSNVATTTTSGFALGGGGGGGTTSTVASTTFTSTSTTTTAISPTTTTFLTNSFFNFPIIASTYPNSLACLSAFTACETNYASCTAELQGGAFAVTISAENGGTTVVRTGKGTGSLGAASATSICSSLSSVACLDIRSTQCAMFGSVGASTTVGFVTGTNGGRGMGCGCCGYVAVAAAAGVGIAGGLV